MVILQDFNESLQILNTILIIDNDVVSECKVCIDRNTKLWNIIYWHTKKEYIHKGYGKLVLSKSLKGLKEKFGKPIRIEYIWNGVNYYVYEWLNKNFSPICTHIYGTGEIQMKSYSLDIDSVVEFFGI